MKAKNLILVLSFFACSSDVSIMKRTDEPSSSDSAITANDTTDQIEPTSEPEDTNESEPSNEMSELTVGYAEIHFRQIACPPCVGAGSEIEISAKLKLHQPTSGDYLDYLQEPGNCTTNLIQTHVSSLPLANTQPASFNGITLNPSASGEWQNSYVYEYQYERNTSYSVISEHGIINNAFTSIEGFDDIQPYTLLWVDPSYAYDAVVSKSGTTFSWSPVVPGSQFEIIVAVYSSDGTAFLGAVSCLENDNGSMFIPGSYFQMYPTYAITAVHLIRHRVSRTPVPELNGYLQSHMLWEVVGTGHIE